MDKALIEKNTKQAIDDQVKKHVANRSGGADAGWGVKDHTLTVLAVTEEVLESYDDPDERRFALFVLFYETANYSSFRQKYERSKVLNAGQRNSGAGLAAHYENLCK